MQKMCALALLYSGGGRGWMKRTVFYSLKFQLKAQAAPEKIKENALPYRLQITIFQQ